MNVQRAKVIADYDTDDGIWLVMWDNGDITEYESAVDVKKAVDRQARRAVRRSDAVVTAIEWRNVPAGFKAPK